MRTHNLLWGAGVCVFGLLISPNAFGQVINIPDCNDPDAKVICARPNQPIVDALVKSGYPYYIGHAEPTLKFISNAGASGNNMQWKFQLPATEPAPTQNGANTANFELYSAQWVSMSLCDPNSTPFGPCIPNSDTNTAFGAGSAFLELQFFPPGSIFTGSGSCSNTQWCVLLHINSVNACMIETTTAAFVTTNGSPAGPKLFLNNGDTVLVTLHDTASGLRADVNDLSTSGTGFMVASGANGFQHNTDSNPANCNSFSPFDYHPEYMTAGPNNVTGWTSLQANVAFDHEIGHWELCTDAACTTNPDPAEQTHVDSMGHVINDCTTIRGVGGCFDSDTDHDGTSYAADYADGTAAHPASFIITSPTNNGVGPLSSNTVGGTTYTQSYKTIGFRTTEGTAGAFYPFYTQAGTSPACVFNFGNDIPGTTTNDFGKANQYGTTTQVNPCIPAAAATPTIIKSFLPPEIPVGATSTLNFTITNTDVGVALTGVNFTDILPANLTIVSFSGSCGGGTITAAANTSLISLTGATLAPSANCSFTVTVRGLAAGLANNVTSALISDDALDGTAATASLAVVLPPSITKAFNPTKILPGGVSTVTFTMTNPNSFAALHAVGFTDTFPAGLVVAGSPGLTMTCPAPVITGATSGSATLSVVIPTLAASASCTVSVNVTAPEGIYNNSVTVTSADAGTGNTAQATLDAATPPKLTKTFGLVSVVPGGTTSLTFNLTNPNKIVTLTGLSFSDTLSSGLLVATPNGLTGSCDGGVITAVAGSNSISVSGATLAAGASCTFSVKVTATGAAQGLLTNTTSTVTSNEALPGGAAVAAIFVGDPFQIRYSSNLNIGDSVVDITNTGANTTGTTNGNICANVYAFSPDEQLVSCCSCLVTPNGLQSLSSVSDLISNTLTPGVETSLVVKLLATAPPSSGSCDASAATQGNLALGLAAWGTTLHSLSTIPGAGPFGLTETAFIKGSLSAAELSRISALCGFIEANGSGFGICKSCRVGALGAVPK